MKRIRFVRFFPKHWHSYNISHNLDSSLGQQNNNRYHKLHKEIRFILKNNKINIWVSPNNLMLHDNNK